MITHIVLLTWKEGVESDAIAQVDEGFARLADEIKEIAAFRFGADLGLYKGNADYALLAEFASEEDLNTYVHHPMHKAFLSDVTGPLLHSFQCLQF